MWRILVLLLFAKESLSCDCPGISINGTDQPYCWQVVDRNASTWSSADDACAAVGARMGQPEDNDTLIALASYLEDVFTLPILTGYVVGNTQTGEIAVVCRANQFYSVANYTDGLILGTPSEQQGCVFISNQDFLMHFGPCSTAAVVLCSQPEETDDYCAVAPTCSTTTTTGYNTTTTYRNSTVDDFDNSSTTTTAFSTSTFSTLSTTSGNDTMPDSTTTLLPSTTKGGSGGGSSTTQSSKDTTCRKGGVWFFDWCVPLWLLILTGVLIGLLALFTILAFFHYCCGCCFCCKSHKIPKAAPVTDVERGPAKSTRDQNDQTMPEEPQIILPPPVTETMAVPIPAPIPLDYHVQKPDTDHKYTMTEPWEPEIVYREVPKVEYEKEERMMLPPAPITARSEAPQFMDSDDDEFPRRLVAGPAAVIIRPVRRREPSPDIPTPRDDPFPALPRRPLIDEDVPSREPEEPKEKKKKPQLEPVVFLHNARPEERPAFLHNAKPEERPVLEEPELPAPSRGPRAFPPPPPSMSRPVSDRPFPEQFKSPSPGPKANRPLPPPPFADSPKRARTPPEPLADPPPKQSRPLTRTPVNRPVINQEPAARPERRSAQPSPPAATPLRPPADPVVPPAKTPPPARSSSGGRRQPAAAPARARSSSPAPRASAPPRAASPFAPKQNAVSPTGGGGSLFKAAPANDSASNLRAARGKLGGVAGGQGEAPRGWKSWASNNGTFSATPGSDL